MTEPAPDIVAAWVALATRSRRALDHAEAALKAAGLPGLAWYDALLELEKAGEAGLRPFELQDRLLLPQYGTSRLLDRLARAGLVTCAPCPEDARGQVMRITGEGRALRQRMWPVYAAAITSVFERLGRDEAGTLARLLGRIGP